MNAADWLAVSILAWILVVDVVVDRYRARRRRDAQRVYDAERRSAYMREVRRLP